MDATKPTQSRQIFRTSGNALIALSIALLVAIIWLGFIMLQQIQSLQQNVELTDSIINANIRTIGQLQRELLRLKVVLLDAESDTDTIDFHRSLVAQRMNEVTLSYHAQALGAEDLMNEASDLSTRWDEELEPIIFEIMDNSNDDKATNIEEAIMLIDEFDLAFNSISTRGENNRKLQAGKANDAAQAFVVNARHILYGLGIIVLAYLIYIGFVISSYIRLDKHREKANNELLQQQTRFRSLLEVATQSTDVQEQLQDAVEEGAKALNMAIGIISRIYGKGYTVMQAFAPYHNIKAGMTCDVEATLCKMTVEVDRVLAVHNITADMQNPEPCFDAVSPGSYIGVPIHVNGEVYGTLSFICDIPRDEPFTEPEHDFVRLMGQWVTVTLERQQSRDELSSYAKSLEQSNTELQQFAYAASHDLQEPLRKVQTFASRIEAKYADKLDDRGRDYLGRMQNAAARMQILIQDLLTLSRVTTQAQPLEDTDFNEVIKGVLSDLEVPIEKSGAQLNIQNLPTIKADATQMRQLFQNLIGNALKFAREDVTPIIEIGYQNHTNAANPQVEIRVKDNGIGFEQQYAERIFSVFQRLHGRMEYEGTGVGLALCRKIVDRHNGTITATSEPNQGATFTIMLPIQ